MKPRQVFVTLELETDVPLAALRRTNLLGFWRRMKVLQVQTNAARSGWTYGWTKTYLRTAKRKTCANEKKRAPQRKT